MRRFIALFVAGLGVVALALASFSSSPEQLVPLNLPGVGAPQPEHVEYILQANTAELPATANVYRFKKTNYTAEHVGKLARKLGMNGVAEPDPIRGGLTVKDGSKILQFEKDTGKFLYLNVATDNDYMIQGRVKRILSDAEVARVAQSTLQEMGLLPPEFKIVAVTSNIMHDGTQNPEAEAGQVMNKSVHLYHFFGGKPVIGVSRIVVDVGDQGAIDEVKRGKGLIRIDSRVKRAVISRVQLLYWEDAGSVDEQPHLQPVYSFEGEAEVDGRIHAFQMIEPAVKGSMFLSESKTVSAPR